MQAAPANKKELGSGTQLAPNVKDSKSPDGVVMKSNLLLGSAMR